MQLRTAFFDLDGTLVDHFAAIHRSYVHTLPQLGLQAPTLTQVRDAVGGGLERAMLRFVSPEQLSAALAIYRPYFDRTMLEDVVLLPGAREALESLAARGIACAVLTNKIGPASRRICQHLGITPWLKGIFGAQDTPWLKPDIRVVKHVLAEMKLPAEGLLMVGDSPFDVETGILSKFPCWAVTTGTHGSEQLHAAGAARVFPDMPSLMTALLAEIGPF